MKCVKEDRQTKKRPQITNIIQFRWREKSFCESFGRPNSNNITYILLLNISDTDKKEGWKLKINRKIGKKKIIEWNATFCFFSFLISRMECNLI